MSAFQGIRVLDLTHVLAGPFAAYQLAVLGADVIKIEPPGEPDMMRPVGPVAALNQEGLGLSYYAQNANKRAITLDLKASRGREIALALAATADVVIENYRAGALEEAGLGHEAVAAANPRIIYCSMTGFGQGAEVRGHTAYDNVIQAMSGLMSTTGTAETRPLVTGAPLLDYGSGLTAAFAIAAALFRRERTGQGQRIDVAMLDVALILMSNLATRVVNGAAFQPRGGNRSETPTYGCYRAADGLLMLGAYSRRQAARLWRLLGRNDVAAAVQDPSAEGAAELVPQQEQLLEAILPSRPAVSWARLLQAGGVPAGPVLSLEEAVRLPHLQHRAIFAEVPGVTGVESGLRVPVSAFTCDCDGPALVRRPPRFGEHTLEILAELGIGHDEAKRLRGDGIV